MGEKNYHGTVVKVGAGVHTSAVYEAADKARVIAVGSYASVRATF